MRFGGNAGKVAAANQLVQRRGVVPDAFPVPVHRGVDRAQVTFHAQVQQASLPFVLRSLFRGLRRHRVRQLEAELEIASLGRRPGCQQSEVLWRPRNSSRLRQMVRGLGEFTQVVGLDETERE